MAASMVGRCAPALPKFCRCASLFLRKPQSAQSPFVGHQSDPSRHGILGGMPPCSRYLNTSCSNNDRSPVIAPSVTLDLEEIEKRLAIPEKKHNAVVNKVNADIVSNASRLFAVIYIHRKQFKVTTGDLIQIIDHIEADVGDKIRLEKVLMVGGDNFSMLGRPLLSKELVEVWATVVEKTETPKKIFFQKKPRKGFKRWVEYKDNLTVLRINTIDVNTVREDH